MNKVRLILLSVLLFFQLTGSASHAQFDDVLSRENDDRAATVEQRRGALVALSNAARQTLSAGDASKAARFLNRAARLQLRLSSPDQALTTYQEALAIIKQTLDAPLDVPLNVDSLNGLGATYRHLGKCIEAQPFLRQAIAVSDQHNYLAGKAEALLTLSECQNQADHVLALNTARESLALWQSLDVKSGVARSLSTIGDFQLIQGNVTEATQSFETALNIGRELGARDQQAQALIGLGFTEFRKGAWEHVLTFLAQAQDFLDEEAEPYKMGQVTAGLAAAFVESGLSEIGIAKFRQALEYYRRAQNPRAQTAVVWDIGKSYYMAGNYPEAIAHLERALADGEAIKEFIIVAMCHDYLGRTYASLNDHAAALGHYERALDLYLRSATPMEAARVRALTGQVYQQQGKVERAREQYQSALATFRALSDQINQSATLYALGNLELKQGQLKAAEDYLRESIAVTEDMRRISTSRDLTTAFSATVHERYESYIECLMRKHRAEPSAGFAARAFETSELSRARALAELLGATQTTLAPGLDPRLAEEERALRQTLRVKEDGKVMLLGGNYKKEELAAAEAELARLKEQYRQVNETIRARHPSYEQITRPAAWDLRRIQEQVVADDETLVLEYSLGAEKSYVWAITRDGLTSHELPARALVEGSVQRVYDLLKFQPEGDTEERLARAADELSRLILSPVAARLNKGRIIVVADGALNYIPFQILPSPDANGEQLVARHEVVNAPSASILGQLGQETKRRRARAKVLAAFGDPVFAPSTQPRPDAGGGGALVASAQMTADERGREAVRDIELGRDTFDAASLNRLFHARRELNNLRDVASGGGAFVATDYEASRERLQKTDLGEFAILHLATHGFLDPARPEKSGLMLSNVNRQGQTTDGFVGLVDIYNLRAPVDLVVLSACRTALGKEVRGEGLISLTRGFMYAGASSVVASLWKVDDEATAELMKHFYANMLQHGMTPASALRAAQNHIRQQPKWRAPYYWAAFTLQGDYRHVIKTTPARSAALNSRLISGAALSLVLLAGALVYWWWWRRQPAQKGSRGGYSTVK